jgi:hypothetical protein
MEKLSVVIPILIDTPARKRNLDCLLQYLDWRKLLPSVTVIEQHSGSRLCTDVPCRYLSVCYEDGLIHRIEMLNRAFKAFPASVLFLWDVDAVFLPEAVDLAVSKALYRKADMVLPFCGYVLDGSNADYKGGDLFTHVKCRAKPSMLNSVGFGAVMNREAWLEAGTENENMLSYGPDDWERWWRWKNLGMKVEMCPIKDSVCLHMSHPNSIYSRTANSMSDHNTAEYEKVKHMSKEVLQQYIKTWPWCNGD